MARNLSDLSLTELQEGLAEVRSALRKVAKNGGVIQYTINGRSGTYGIEALERWERDYVRAIDSKKGRRQAFRRAVPMDDRR